MLLHFSNSTARPHARNEPLNNKDPGNKVSQTTRSSHVTPYDVCTERYKDNIFPPPHPQKNQNSLSQTPHCTCAHAITHFEPQTVTPTLGGKGQWPRRLFVPPSPCFMSVMAPCLYTGAQSTFKKKKVCGFYLRHQNTHKYT